MKQRYECLRTFTVFYRIRESYWEIVFLSRHYSLVARGNMMFSNQKQKKTKQNKTKFIKFPMELGYQIDVLETEAFYCFYCSPLIFLLYFDKRC